MAKSGFLDSIEDGVLEGWALDDNASSPAILDISVDGVVIAKVTCSEFRPDLVTGNRGTGWHGFSYPLPVKYMQSRARLIVSFADGGPVLENGRRFLPGFVGRVLTSSALSSLALGKGLWCIDELNLSDSQVVIEGWCIPPYAVPVPLAFTHNGTVLRDSKRLRRNDIAIMLGMERDEIGFGFRAGTPLTEACRRHDFFFEHAYTKRPFDANQGVYYICEDKPLPPKHLRIHSHGSPDAVSFVKEGSTAYVQIQRFLQEYFSKSIEDFSRILDWGCGTGRVFRYLSDGALAKLTGIDIDPQATEWCRKSFPNGEFLTVSIDPPTPIASGTFDLIYANSVLTHLRENDHDRWLQELYRLAKPKAVVLLTTFGELNWWRRKLPSSSFHEWKIDHAGFFDAGQNDDLDEIGIGDYYRNVFISHEYIARIWSRYFEIVDFVPGGIGSLQDEIGRAWCRERV